MCYVQDTSRDPFARSVKQSFAISSNRIVGCTSTPKILIKTTKASVHSYCITYFDFLEFEPNHPTQLTMREAASIEAKQPTHRAKGSVRANQRPRHLDTNQAYRGQEDKKQRAEVEVLQKLPQRREQIWADLEAQAAKLRGHQMRQRAPKIIRPAPQRHEQIRMRGVLL